MTGVVSVNAIAGVTCPKLECNTTLTDKALPAGKCFSMGTETAFDTLYARDCFDEVA